jgi:hypothetical protein
MGEPEGLGDEGLGGQETTGGARKRRGELREQAELAWTRVQRVIHKPTTPSFTTEKLLEKMEQVPSSSYVAGIAVSFFASALLLSLGRRSTSTLVGLGGPLVLGAALYVKSLRQARQV